MARAPSDRPSRPPRRGREERVEQMLPGRNLYDLSIESAFCCHSGGSGWLTE
jgi:hypothetical protein